ncbi:hypothetical protein T492DRAFT_1012002 [Pavlovales sp. CCMP2436]|nr:hypothetical protein T492DRAFT_1012002 [Pavlovales sp. CCMP2436]
MNNRPGNAKYAPERPRALPLAPPRPDLAPPRFGAAGNARDQRHARLAAAHLFKHIFFSRSNGQPASKPTGTRLAAAAARSALARPAPVEAAELAWVRRRERARCPASAASRLFRLGDGRARRHVQLLSCRGKIATSRLLCAPRRDRGCRAAVRRGRCRLAVATAVAGRELVANAGALTAYAQSTC